MRSLVQARGAIAISIPQCLALALMMGIQFQFSFCHAQLLHPSDMAIGRWKVSLHRRDRSLVESMIFPPTFDVDDGDTQSDKKNTADDANILSPYEKYLQEKKSRTPPNNFHLDRKLDCELILDADGSFVLTPNVDLNKKKKKNKKSKKNKKQRQQQQPNLRCLPLRGKWQLRPNPYCVTDRHFDELTMKSYPKVKVYMDQNHSTGAFASTSTSTSTSTSSTCREQITMEMHCKIWGRFGSNTIRYFLKRPRGRDAGRMVQGKLSIVKYITNNESDGSNGNAFERSSDSKRRRVLCATFRGTRQ